MNITDVNKAVKGHKRKKRRGRGAASGLGKTAGRGQKGLGQRSGGVVLKGFVGGQSPLRQRIPKRGFNNAVFRTEYLAVNLRDLEKRFAEGDTVDVEALVGIGFSVSRGEKVKILGTGELTKKLAVSAHAFSKSAREKIEKAGGSVTVIDASEAAADADGSAE